MRPCLGAFFQVGGARALEPVLRDLDAGGGLALWAREPALGHLRARGFAADPVTAAGIRDAAFGRYGLVLTDTINMARSPDGPLLGRVWEAARAAGAPTLAFVDSWWGYDNRFADPGEGGRSILPDVIAVVDETARQGMLGAGHGAGSLRILGSPHLDALRAMRPRAGERGGRFRARQGLDGECACLFVSQPLERALPGGARDWGFNELTTLAALAAAAAALPEETRRRFRLLVLPHPEDDAAALARAAAAAPVPCRVLSGEPPLDAVCGADLVCGMFSMLLTEAALLGRVVLSVQLGLKREDMLVTNMVGATRCARTPEELAEMLRDLACDPACRRAALDAQERFAVVGDSRTRWADQLRIMRTGRP